MENILCIDFETTGLEFYRPDFRIISMAAAWYVSGQLKTWFSTDINDIEKFLLDKQHMDILAHNIGYEYGCVSNCLPNVPTSNFKFDTMRLVQVYDGGGEQFDRFEWINKVGQERAEKQEKIHNQILKEEGGKSLAKSCIRILDNYEDHKEEAYSYLREKYPECQGNEGGYLKYLPPKLLESYNMDDVIYTFKLYEKITDDFMLEGYDWSFDHELYIFLVKEIIDAESYGVRIDREECKKSIISYWEEKEALKHEFFTVYQRQISEITRYMKSINKKFKFGLRTACYELLFHIWEGIEPKFYSEKGNPKFGKDYLKQWGEGGKMLENKGTLQIAITQACNLYKLSEADGRWHLTLNPTGTRSGRLSGGIAD